jgi:hypothetical protein
MRRPTALILLALACSLGAVGAACSDDSGSPDPATTTSAAPGSTTTTAALAPDAELAALALEVGDLPPGFEPSADVDDTITAFCANEDAAAGLQASAREVRGFRRTAGGASVVQLLFRFREDGAATFVAQAEAILGRCSNVPDATGLAFEYDALAPALEDLLRDGSEDHVGRHGTSVGSGNLTVDLAVLRRGDVGQLVAVLGLDLPRADLDSLAAVAFAAAALP